MCVALAKLGLRQLHVSILHKFMYLKPSQDMLEMTWATGVLKTILFLQELRTCFLLVYVRTLFDLLYHQQRLFSTCICENSV